MEKKVIISAKEVHKSYPMHSRNRLTVLQGLDFEIFQGEKVAVVGDSGSGKTTLLNLLGLLDSYESGNIHYYGPLPDAMKTFIPMDSVSYEALHSDEITRTLFFRHVFGFIFQMSYAFETLNVLDNIIASIQIKDPEISDHKAQLDARFFLENVGMAEKLSQYPRQLSHGEKQRLGIARALINNPPILFADEPTGNLDHKRSEEVISMLLDEKLVEAEKTLVLITHHLPFAIRCDRIFVLREGKIVKTYTVKEFSDKEALVLDIIKVMSGMTNEE